MILDTTLLSTQSLATYNAVLNAHGLYNTEQFVLRLSPRNHELIDSLNLKLIDLSQLSGDELQAYSTYLHETIHWWQHVGSTVGFLLSTCYPNQTHMNADHIRELCSIVKPSKSLKKFSYNGELSGITHLNNSQALANTITNNFMDVQFYKEWLLRPERSIDIYNDSYFESQGHSFHLAYNGLISNIQPIIDNAQNFLPSIDRWGEEFKCMADNEVLGYYYGSGIARRHTSLFDLYEGQASFNQMQFLTCFNTELTLDDFRRIGMLYGVYERAFIKFIEFTGLEQPQSALDPVVNLFLLVLDLSINPVEGFPCDIQDFKNFINYADPNIRFQLLCLTINKSRKYCIDLVINRTKEDYLYASEFLMEAAGLIHPSFGWEEVKKWRNDSECVKNLMDEYREFDFKKTNIVHRVLLSIFIEFTADKSLKPEIFCWSGFWRANADRESNVLWLKHLSLFSDKKDDKGIFIRDFPDKKPENLLGTLNYFYGSTVIYDLTRQWIFEDGSFRFNFDWLSEKTSEEEWQEFAAKQFMGQYGVNIADIQYY